MAGWQPAGEPDWIVISEVSGVDEGDGVAGVSAAVVSTWIRAGILQAYPAGDKWRVRRSEVQRLITLTTNPAALGG